MKSANRVWAPVVACLALLAARTARSDEGPPPVDENWGVPKNGLSSTAFRLNAITTNRQAIKALLGNALNDSLLQDPDIKTQLLDFNARALMNELVRCALGKKDGSPDSFEEIWYDNPQTQQKERWYGQLGLCQHSEPEIGDWRKGPPTRACQELVTACIMARVNASEKSVPVMLHAAPSALQPDTLFANTQIAHAEHRFREIIPGIDPGEGQLIPSFEPQDGVSHDRGWREDAVGKCDGSAGRIALAIPDPAICGSTEVRVCAGINGCLTGWEYHRSRLNGLGIPYSKRITTQTGACLTQPVRFECPTDVGVGGYYSVMVRSSRISQPLPPPPPPSLFAPLLHLQQGSGEYPLRSDHVFTFMEGAYFGNLFDQDRSFECGVIGNQLRCVPVDLNPEIVFDASVVRAFVDAGLSTPGDHTELLAQHTASSRPGDRSELLTQRKKMQEESRDKQPGLTCDILPNGTSCSLMYNSYFGTSLFERLPYNHVYACYASPNQDVAYLNRRLCDIPSPVASGLCFPHPPTPCEDSCTRRVDAQYGDTFEECKAPDQTTRATAPSGGTPTAARSFDYPITIYLNDPCDLIDGHDLCKTACESLPRMKYPRSNLRCARGCCGCSSQDPSGILLPLLAAAFALHRRRALRGRPAGPSEIGPA
jgi:uncharacterized protein (TIGR03382 family)